MRTPLQSLVPQKRRIKHLPPPLHAILPDEIVLPPQYHRRRHANIRGGSSSHVIRNGVGTPPHRSRAGVRIRQRRGHFRKSTAALAPSSISRILFRFWVRRWVPRRELPRGTSHHSHHSRYSHRMSPSFSCIRMPIFHRTIDRTSEIAALPTSSTRPLNRPPNPRWNKAKCHSVRRICRIPIDRKIVSSDRVLHFREGRGIGMGGTVLRARPRSAPLAGRRGTRDVRCDRIVCASIRRIAELGWTLRWRWMLLGMMMIWTMMMMTMMMRGW